MEAIIVIVVVVVILAIVLIALYNNLVQLRNRVDNAWSQIDVQLQRRLDLIPNLVETVKGYAAHESGTLQKVTEARSAVCNATTPEQKMAADNFLSGTLKSLFAVSEAYPDLKANANFQQLQAEISATVMKYNSAIQTFPGVLVAGLFKFTARENFDANAAASAAPVVSFGQGNDAAQAPSVNMGTAPKDPSDTPSVK